MRGTILCLSLVCGFLTLGACATRNANEPGSCFVVGYLDVTASAPLFIAQDLGLFDKQGVCVTTEVFATSNTLVDALLADRLDYVVEASADPALALQARSPGRFFITAASTISEDEPFDALLVRADSDITSLAQLQGRSVAVFPGTTAAALLRHFLATNDLDADSIDMVPTPPANMLAALKSGAVDAVHAYEPTWTLGLSDPEIRQFFGTVYGRQLAPNPQGISLLRRATAEERPEEARALIRAFDEALDLMRSDTESVRDVLEGRFSLPNDAVQQMHLLYMAPHDEIDLSSLDAYVDLLIEVGELDVRPDLEGLFLD